MRVGGRDLRTIWVADDGWTVEIIDQTRLPHELAIARLIDVEDVRRAIREMQVRGAPLIGVAAAFGVCLAMRADPSDAALDAASNRLLDSRPTAVNLRWALGEMRAALAPAPPAARADLAYRRAAAMADDDVATCRAIAEHGLLVLRGLWEARRRRDGDGTPLSVLTHCNAGWLATVDWGTALAPVYAAHRAELPVHVWVSETRPRNQGFLTAWELGQQGVPHTVLADNAAGHLLQRGVIDVCITGTDRTTARGDVCNKVGTYLKALAARACGVPFYAAVPGSSIDWTLEDGVRDIPIEERAASEVTTAAGRAADGTPCTVALAPPSAAAVNPAFDVTPADLITGIVTERGVCTPAGLRALYGR